MGTAMVEIAWQNNTPVVLVLLDLHSLELVTQRCMRGSSASDGVIFTGLS